MRGSAWWGASDGALSNHRQDGRLQADAVRGEGLITIVMFALTATAGALDPVTFLGPGAFAAPATGKLLLLDLGWTRGTGNGVEPPSSLCGSVYVRQRLGCMDCRVDRYLLKSKVPSAGTVCTAPVPIPFELSLLDGM